MEANTTDPDLIGNKREFNPVIHQAAAHELGKSHISVIFKSDLKKEKKCLLGLNTNNIGKSWEATVGGRSSLTDETSITLLIIFKLLI